MQKIEATVLLLDVTVKTCTLQDLKTQENNISIYGTI